MSSAEQTLAAVRGLLDTYGPRHYGEAVTQLDHAVQGAVLAREAGDDEEITLAAFLHDVGHLLEHDGVETMGNYGVMAHDKLGADWLRAHGFSERVALLVQLHVPAKRYLCAIDAGYYAELSEASKITLGYQGGPMTADEAAAFAALPDCAAALRVRRLDEAAKDGGWSFADVEWIWPMMATHLARQH